MIVGTYIVVQQVDMFVLRLRLKGYSEEHLQAQTPRSAFLRVDSP